ncbi:MAG: OmpW family protein [Flavobacteriaceae bacterium]|nr:OmpW family protein [Flavobacteriaceae bacterium]|tara:strand:+ start:22043 stop:22615 length:573 start_codon:yes stop_codon:yes gene_type:complete
MAKKSLLLLDLLLINQTLLTMKKLFFLLVVVLFTMQISAQETRFGATAGYLNGASKITVFGEETSGTDSGFYGGLVAEIGLSESFAIQTEVLYMNIDDSSLLQVPFFGKIYVSEKFFFQAGPTITYTLEEIAEDFTKFNLGVGGGLGYDITEDFFIETRTSFQLNNYYNGRADIKSRINFISLGIGYKFS